MEVFPPDESKSCEEGSTPAIKQVKDLNVVLNSLEVSCKEVASYSENSYDVKSEESNLHNNISLSENLFKSDVKRKWDEQLSNTIQESENEFKRTKSMVINSGELTIQLVNSSGSEHSPSFSNYLSGVKPGQKIKQEEPIYDASHKMHCSNENMLETFTNPTKTEITDAINTEITDAINTKITDAIHTEIKNAIKTEINDAIKSEINDAIKTEINDAIKMEFKQTIHEDSFNFKTETVEKNSDCCSETKENTIIDLKKVLPELDLLASRDVKSDSGFTDDLSTESKSDLFSPGDELLSYDLKNSDVLQDLKPTVEALCAVSRNATIKSSVTETECSEEKKSLNLDDTSPNNADDSLDKKMEKVEDTSDKTSKKDDKLSKKKKFERCNIRDIKLEDELDAVTLSAQKEEQERIRRLQEAQMRALHERLQQIEVEKEALTQLFNQPPEEAANLFDTTIDSADVSDEPKEVAVKNENDVVLVESSTDDKKNSLQNIIPESIEENIIDISSSSSGNESDTDDSDKKDDDVMVLSDEGETESEAGGPDDPNNSGAHTNDCFNLPDEEGRVLVNVGHPPEDPDIFLAPQISKVIKPHQIGGIRFLYDNVVENLERYKASSGFGCILAHSMGLGKTVQVVSFVDVFLRHTPATLVLCIVPINTIQNWKAEFDMWVPATNCVDDAQVLNGDVRPRDYNVYTLNENFKTMAARCSLIAEWRKQGGVLLMGYEMYRMLALRKMPKIPLKKRKRLKKQEIPVEPETNEEIKKFMDEMYEFIVIPGPDLVICDEGHRIKNSLASTSMALKSIKTRRRVVLTGYPLQNNLLEYWCMVDFVRPNYLGSRAEFCNMFERPISNGQCIDSTPRDRQLMRFRSHVLHSLLVGFVQRRGHSVLRAVLPKKEEHVLLIRMTSIQRQLYKCFVKDLLYVQQATNPLKLFAVCCKIWNHPDILFKLLQEKKVQEDIDLDIEISVATGVSVTRCMSKKRGLNQGKLKSVSRPLKVKGLKSDSCLNIEKADTISSDPGNKEGLSIYASSTGCKEEFSSGNAIRLPVQSKEISQSPYKNQYSSNTVLNPQFCQSNYPPMSGQQCNTSQSQHFPSRLLHMPYTSRAPSQPIAEQQYSQCGQTPNQFGKSDSSMFSQTDSRSASSQQEEKRLCHSLSSSQNEFPAAPTQYLQQLDTSNQYAQGSSQTQFVHHSNNKSSSLTQEFTSEFPKMYSTTIPHQPSSRQYPQQSFLSPPTHHHSDHSTNAQFSIQVNEKQIDSSATQLSYSSTAPVKPHDSDQMVSQFPQVKSFTGSSHTQFSQPPEFNGEIKSTFMSLPSAENFPPGTSSKQTACKDSQTNKNQQFSQSYLRTEHQHFQSQSMDTFPTHQPPFNTNHPSYSETYPEQPSFAQNNYSHSYLPTESLYTDQSFATSKTHKRNVSSKQTFGQSSHLKFDSKQLQSSFSQMSPTTANNAFVKPLVQSASQNFNSVSSEGENEEQKNFTSHNASESQFLQQTGTSQSFFQQPLESAALTCQAGSQPMTQFISQQMQADSQPYLQKLPDSKFSENNSEQSFNPQTPQQFSLSRMQSVQPYANQSQSTQNFEHIPYSQQNVTSHNYSQEIQQFSLQTTKSQQFSQPNQSFSSQAKNSYAQNQKSMTQQQTTAICSSQVEQNSSQFNQTFSQQSSQIYNVQVPQVAQHFPQSPQHISHSPQKIFQPVKSPQQFSQSSSSQQFSQSSASSQQFSQSASSPQLFSQPTPSPQQFSQPASSPQQFCQPVPSPQQFSQPVPSPQQFSQPVPSPQQFSQPVPSPQQFSQSVPSPQQFSQSVPSPQQFSQPAPSPQQFSQLSPSTQQFPQQTSSMQFPQPVQSPQPFSQPSPSSQHFPQTSLNCQQFSQLNTTHPLPQSQHQASQSSQSQQQFIYPNGKSAQQLPQSSNQSMLQYGTKPSHSSQIFETTHSQQQFSHSPTQSSEFKEQLRPTHLFNKSQVSETFVNPQSYSQLASNSQFNSNTNSQQFNHVNQSLQFEQQGNQSQQFDQKGSPFQQFDQKGIQNQPFEQQGIQSQSFDQQDSRSQKFDQQECQSQQFDQQKCQSQQFDQQKCQSQQFDQQKSQSQQFDQQESQSQQFDQKESQSQQFEQQESQSQQFDQQESQSQQFEQQESQSQQFDQQESQSQQFEQQESQSQQFDQQESQSQQFEQQESQSQQFDQQESQSQQFDQQQNEPQQYNKLESQTKKFEQSDTLNFNPQESSAQFGRLGNQQPAQLNLQTSSQNTLSYSSLDSNSQTFKQPTLPFQFDQQNSQGKHHYNSSNSLPLQFNNTPTQSPQQYPLHYSQNQQFSQQSCQSPQYCQPSHSPKPFPSLTKQSNQQYIHQSIYPNQFSQQVSEISQYSQQFNQQSGQSLKQSLPQSTPNLKHYVKASHPSHQFPQQNTKLPGQQSVETSQLSTQQYNQSQYAIPSQHSHSDVSSQTFPNSFSQPSVQESSRGQFHSEVQSNIQGLSSAKSESESNPKLANIMPTGKQTLHQNLLSQVATESSKASSNNQSFPTQILLTDNSPLNSPHTQQQLKRNNGNASFQHAKSTLPRQDNFTIHGNQDSSVLAKCPKTNPQRENIAAECLDTLQTSRKTDIVLGDGEQQSCDSAVTSYREKMDSSINYEWAVPIMKDYVVGVLENSHKMMVLFVIIAETLRVGDKLLVFSQSLSTLDLLEHFLGKIQIPRKSNQPEQSEVWCRNKNYFRLDGGTSAQEREKLINEFNRNDNVSLFLLSTRAGCLGINLVGANRIVVMDASWNPCHDAQAVCRIYRYGQKKQCHIYRLVTDNSLEKRIYDRQVNKQGMSDRVVDELNPESNFTWKDVTTLIQDDEDDGPVQELSKFASSYSDKVLKYLVSEMSSSLSKEPFEHESLLLDRKDLKLTKQEKRLAKQSYEMAKRANMINIRTTYTYLPSGAANGGQIVINNKQCQWVGGTTIRVLPNQGANSGSNVRSGTTATPITASPSLMSSLFKQGVMVQKLTMPSNVSIPVLTPGAPPVVIPAGQDVLVLRTPKGVYLRLPDGRIIAVQLPPSLLAKTQFRPNVVTHFRPAALKGSNQPINTVINTPRGQSIGIIKQTLQCGGTVRYMGPRNTTGTNVSKCSAPEVIDLSDDDEPSLRKCKTSSNASANSSESETSSVDLDKMESHSLAVPGKQITIRKISSASQNSAPKEKCEIPRVLTKNKQITIMPIIPSTQQNRQKFAPQLAHSVRVQQMLLQPPYDKKKSISKSASRILVSSPSSITAALQASKMRSITLQSRQQQKNSENVETNKNSSIKSNEDPLSNSALSQEMSNILQKSKGISISLAGWSKDKAASLSETTSHKLNPNLQISSVEATIPDHIPQKNNLYSNSSEKPITSSVISQNTADKPLQISNKPDFNVQLDSAQTVNVSKSSPSHASFSGSDVSPHPNDPQTVQFPSISKTQSIIPRKKKSKKSTFTDTPYSIPEQVNHFPTFPTFSSHIPHPQALHPYPSNLLGNPLNDMQWPQSTFHPFSQSSFYSSGPENNTFPFQPPSFPLPNLNQPSGSGGDKTSQMSTSDL